MSRARTLAGAIGSDGALNVADVAGLAAVASSGSASDLSTGTLPIARIADGAVTAAKLASSAVTDKLGYTPVNKAGDTITGNLSVNGTVTANVLRTNLPTSNLVLYWDFSGTGSTVSDISGNNNTGTISGATRVLGKNGSGIRIAGGNDSVVSSVTAVPGAKTIAFWLKTSRVLSENDDVRFGFQGNNGGNGFMFMFGVGSIQDVGFWGYGASNDWAIGPSLTTSVVNDGSWHHIAATHNGSGVGYVFIDGVKRTQYYNGTVTQSYMTLTDTLGANAFQIGNSSSSAVTEVIMDSAVYYSRMLSDSEIVQLRDATS